MMEWNAWIGQHEDPVEVKPLTPPPVDDTAIAEADARKTELERKASLYFKETDFSMKDPITFCEYDAKGIPLEPELIQGILRRGHKLMVSGASKSGKSFMLIELALCMATGRPWMGYKCEECKVLYVNLEISEPSFAHRIECVSEAMDINMKECDSNLKIINLRGTSVALSKMAGALIGTIIMEEANTFVPFSAVILDPIYKISNGEENSAKDVGDFCHELDRIATATGASIIYSHHH
ncbi:MAG: AAA family ATPase, partial [Clostridia bacterium]|nr:AAA family ATPase [Clostridia bacterium]